MADDLLLGQSAYFNFLILISFWLWIWIQKSTCCHQSIQRKTEWYKRMWGVNTKIYSGVAAFNPTWCQWTQSFGSTACGSCRAIAESSCWSTSNQSCTSDWTKKQDPHSSFHCKHCCISLPILHVPTQCNCCPFLYCCHTNKFNTFSVLIASFLYVLGKRHGWRESIQIEQKQEQSFIHQWKH